MNNLINSDDEQTRLMGIPVGRVINWREVLTKCLFGGVIVGMVVMGMIILFSNANSESTLSLPETNEDILITSDFPGAEAVETIDDSPGEVTLSDVDFARVVSKAINNN